MNLHRPTRRLATLLLLGAPLLLAACFGDDQPPPTASPSPASIASPTAPASTATPPPEDNTNLPPGLAPSPSDTWQQLELRPGDEVPDLLGAFIFNAATAAGTLWSLHPEAVDNPDYVFVGTSPGGNFVVARGQPSHLVNTSSGQSFTWGDRARLLLIDDRGLALFQRFQGCQFWAVDLSGTQPAPLAAFQLPAERNCNVTARFSPASSDLLVAIQGNNFDGGATLFAVDLTTGTPGQLATLDPPYVTFANAASGHETALLTASLPGIAWVASYRWSSETLAITSIATGALPRGDDKAPPTPGRLTISPDGRWLAWSDSDDLGAGQGMGGEAEWPVVVIASVQDAAPAVRAQRVALTNGIVTFDWLADSSALIVQSEDGFALLATDGSLQQLPFPVAFHSDPVPIPAPDATDRFAYNGRIVDEAGNEVGDPPAVADAWSTLTEARRWSWWTRSHYAWGASADRLVLVRTEVPGRDFGRGGVATLGLPPHIVTGPAAATPGPVHLRVASDGDNLNVRAAPGLAAERIGKLPHGALITVDRDTTIDFCGLFVGCSILNDPDLTSENPWWLYIRAEDGLAGWVTSEFVEWAD